MNTNNRRKENWEKLLADYIHNKRNQPFDWNGMNCCLFACDWIRLVTGIDPAKGMRKQACTLKGAAQLLKQHGGVEAIAEAKCLKHGFLQVLPTYAQRGDILLVDLNSFNNPSVHAVEDHSLGVCMGAEAAFVGRNGLVFVPITACRRAWRIN